MWKPTHAAVGVASSLVVPDNTTSPSEFYETNTGMRALGVGLIGTQLDSIALDPAEGAALESRLNYMSILVGALATLICLPVLWVVECRKAELESLVALARVQACTDDAKTQRQDRMNSLVHVQGANARALARVADDQFNVAFDSGCIKLRVKVEVFQLVQSEQREKPGDGTETVTAYSYTEQWSSSWHDSICFDEASRRGVNKKPYGLQLGVTEHLCSHVEYGDGFVLPDCLLKKCTHYEAADVAAEKIGPSIFLSKSKWRFVRLKDGYYFHGRNRNAPAIGDARVSFELVLDGPATVLALQVESKAESKATFLPYRLVRTFCHSMSDEEKSKALRAAAEKTLSQLKAESGGLFAPAQAPEIYHIFGSSMTLDECLQAIRATAESATGPTSKVRLVCWASMFVGIYAMLYPFTAKIMVLPWIGAGLARLGGAMLGVLSLAATVLVATLSVVSAYMLYHPILAAKYGLGASLVLVGAVILANHALAEFASP